MGNAVIIGSKSSGEKARTPVESPDSLQSIAYAKILDLVSEGEIYGLVNGEASIYLNETPILNENGTRNFSGTTYDVRNGTQDQSYIQGFPASENEVGVGVELKFVQPYTRAINNNSLSAVRIRLAVNQLVETKSNGDRVGSSVSYAIDLSTAGGAYQTVIQNAFTGKTTSTYERSHRIDLPPSNSGWTIRVRRLTGDSTSDYLQNGTSVVSVTEIIDAKNRYPNSAIVATTFDASQFNAIPTRSFHLRGRLIRVPSNYDAIGRSYSGIWDGTFKTAYSNNPAWVFYDLLLHQRYGLGHILTGAQVDRYSLYRIGQYCDELVSDGKGGMEPRFTANLYLQSRADALKVLQDMAAIFRGMSYWGAGSVIATADTPSDPVYTFTNANVIDGKFTYAGTSRKSRLSVALVSWNDPADFYRSKVEYVEDREALARYGYQQTEVNALGCTSQGQANRLGRWALLTNKLETETVSFSVGLDAAGDFVRPGAVVNVADNDRAGRRIGGRLKDASLDAAVLDGDLQVFPGDRITVVGRSGKPMVRIIKDIGYAFTVDQTDISIDSTMWTVDKTADFETVKRVVFDEPLEEIPALGGVWVLESSTLKAQLFRILSIAERSGEDELGFDIVATKHVPDKFDNIDSGTRIDTRPITVIPPSVQDAPDNITITSDYLVDQGNAVNSMTISWDAAPNALYYEVQWRRDSQSLVSAGRTGTTSMTINGIYAGVYVARVRAVNALDITSIWGESEPTQLNGKTTPPPVVSFLKAESKIFGIRLTWGIPEGFETADLQKTEIWYGTTNSLDAAQKFGDYAYPQTDLDIIGLQAGTSFFFWARLVDRSGNMGSFFGPINGQASSDATAILDYLNGEITESQLGETLLEKVNSGGGADIKIEQIKSDLAAMYTIKTQLTANGQTYLSGIGVGVENNGGIITSQVLVAASRFAVIDPNSGTVNTPFVIQNGAAYINNAFIGDGTITNAKIGDTIQSTAIANNGQPVWKLSKSGTFQINSVGSGGNTVITPDAYKVYDSNGVLRVQLGNLSA